MGLSQAQADGTVRVSLGALNTMDEMDEAARHMLALFTACFANSKGDKTVRDLLVRFGEVFLKGQNRPFFMKKLMDHIRQAVRPVNGRVWMSEGRFYVSDFTDMDECIRRVTRVFGVHSVSLGHRDGQGRFRGDLRAGG